MLVDAAKEHTKPSLQHPLFITSTAVPLSLTSTVRFAPLFPICLQDSLRNTTHICTISSAWVSSLLLDTGTTLWSGAGNTTVEF